MAGTHDHPRQAPTERLKSVARDLGLDAVGIARAQAYPHGPFFRAWLDRGFHGTMGYLAHNAERRLDPRAVLPDARSVVCAAKVYHRSGTPPPHDGSGRGVVSPYAWGDDYHDHMGRTLEHLAGWVRREHGDGTETRTYVDTGPVLERDVAATAGVGWIGKNTMLLSRELGSYFFLGEILTTVPFVPDAPTTDHCGSCTACLDACPTDAFAEPYDLDATRCISYLTIELKGSIPRELRPGMGNHIFGCDICQDVCPWNRRAPTCEDASYAPRDGLHGPQLAPLMSMTDAAFRERFKGSPITRTKRRGLLRNVAVALGNVGGPGAVGALVSSLGDAEPLVRGHAAWALGRLGGKVAGEALRDALMHEADSGVRLEIETAIDDLGHSGASSAEGSSQ